MSNGYLDPSRRGNADWPQISLADGVSPLNRIYRDQHTAPADMLRRYPKQESASRSVLTCQVVANPTVGTITLTDGRLIKIDGTTAGTYEAASSLETVVRANGLTAAQLADAIKTAVIQSHADLTAETDGDKLGIFASDGTNAIASNSLTWVSGTATLSLLRPSWPASCIPGTYHPQCSYLKLVRCSLTSATDTLATFTREWQIDMERLGEEVPAADIEALLKVGSLKSRQREASGIPPREFLPWVQSETTVSEALPNSDPDTDADVSAITPRNIASSRKQSTRTTWGTPYSKTYERFDADTGKIRIVTREAVPAGTEGEPINASGEIKTVQQVDDLWAIRTTEEAMGLAGEAGGIGVASRTRRYRDVWSWPRVLDYIRFWTIYADPQDFTSAVEGYGWRPVWLANGYNGPCTITLVERWTKKMPVLGGDADWQMGPAWVTGTIYAAGSYVTVDGETYRAETNHTAGASFAVDLAASKWRVSSPELPEETPMLPQPIEFYGQELSSVQIPECLHAEQVIYDSSALATYPATSPARWPETILGRVLVDADNGGWLTRMFYVDSPDPTGRSTGLDLIVAESTGTSFKLSWTPGGGATKLDVSTDPTFEGGFLTGYEDLTVASTAPYEHTVTGAARGVIYYARVRRTAAGLTSNTCICITQPLPEIQIAYNGTTKASGDTITVAETAVVGASVTFEIDVTSIGLRALQDLAVSKSGADASMFTLGSLASELAPSGGTASLSVTFTPSASGTRVCALSFASSDSSSPFVLNIQAPAISPEINVQYSAASYASGSTVELSGTTSVGSSSDHTLTVQNTGTGNLTLGTVEITGTGWSIVTPPTSPIAGGGSATCVVRFTPTGEGGSVGTLVIPSNDADEPTTTLYLSAQATVEPNAALVNPWGGSQATGSTFFMGGIIAGQTRTLTITIQNNGTGTLSGLAASVSVGLFFLGSLPATILAPGASTTLAVTFQPPGGEAAGLKSATLTITSDDPDTPSYTLSLSARVQSGNGSITQLERPTGTVLVDGSSTIQFGSVVVTGGIQALTLTYRNVGQTTSGLGTTMGGTHSAEFTPSGLTTAVASTPASIGSDDFTVTFDPAGFGLRTATLTITDTADNPNDDFLVNLQGYGVPSNSIRPGQSAAVIVGQADSDDQVSVASSIVTPSPSHAAVSAGGRLAIADPGAHRVLIWNTVPTTTGTPADLVLGQTDFTSTSSGATSSKLNTPYSVAWHGENLWVLDSGNHRILRFSKPVTNGQAANIVLGQTNFTNNTSGTSSTKFNGPTKLLIHGGKMFLADTQNNRVLIWSSVPTATNTAANVVVGQSTLTASAAGTTSTTLTAPTGVAVTIEGRLAIADGGNNRVLLYANIPTSNGAAATNVIGQADFVSSSSGLTINTVGGVSDVACSSGGTLAVSDTGNHRVLLWYQTPTTDGSNAHGMIGQQDFTTGTSSTNGLAVMSAPEFMAWNGNNLLVAGTLMRRTMIFNAS